MRSVYRRFLICYHKDYEEKIYKDRKRSGMMSKKGIVSFDLDMTLLNHEDWSIPASAMDAIEALREKYHIVIASGRDMDHHYSSHYKELIRPDAIIHTNGTRVTVDGKIIFEHFMDRGLLRRLIDFSGGKPYAVGLTIGSDDYYVNPEIVVKHDEIRWKDSVRNFKEPQALYDAEIRTLTFIGNEQSVRELEHEFPELKFPMFAGGTGADVVEKEVSKAEGLKMLCTHYGIDLSRTVAFGDSMNDYEIVREAGIGVAMGNAIEPLKKVADYVTDHIRDDGIWKGCVALGLLK